MKQRIESHKLNLLFMMTLVVVSSFISSLCLTTIGCGKRDSCTGIVADSTTILSIALSRHFSFASLTCEDSLDPDSIDIIKIWNGDSILFAFKWQNNSNELHLNDTTGNSYGVPYTFSLISNFASAEGTITFPEMAAFTYPSENDTLPIEDIEVTWADCYGADYYSLYKEIAACDSAGDLIEMEYIDTILATPSITIWATEFNVIEAAFYVVYLFLRPKAGILPSMGEPANMTGNILGYMYADGDGDIMSFYVGTPANISQSSGEALSISGK